MFHCALKSGAIMSSNGEVHGAKLQRENTALTAARLNEGSKTSISTSHEMKGKIVDVHPVALKRRKEKKKKKEKKGKRKAVNTKDSVKDGEGQKDRQTEGQTGLEKRDEGREEI